LALQVVADRVAGNVGCGRVIVNLQVAADRVVVDRHCGIIVVGLEIVADRVAGTSIYVIRADLDRTCLGCNDYGACPLGHAKLDTTAVEEVIATALS
jgi:hypothetical protein